jgi:hypothetical protein
MSKPVAALFCDDVRLEANGKLIFIGIYSGAMVVPQFPWSGRICPVVLFDGPPTELNQLRFRLGTPDGAVFGSAEFDLEIEGNDDAKTTMLPLPAAAIAVSGPETIQLWLGMGGEEELMVGQLAIRRAEQPSEG